MIKKMRQICVRSCKNKIEQRQLDCGEKVIVETGNICYLYRCLFAYDIQVQCRRIEPEVSQFQLVTPATKQGKAVRGIE